MTVGFAVGTIVGFTVGTIVGFTVGGTVGCGVSGFGVSGGGVIFTGGNVGDSVATDGSGLGCDVGGSVISGATIVMCCGSGVPSGESTARSLLCGAWRTTRGRATIRLGGTRLGGGVSGGGVCGGGVCGGGVCTGCVCGGGVSGGGVTGAGVTGAALEIVARCDVTATVSVCGAVDPLSIGNKIRTAKSASRKKWMKIESAYART
jgi:hypothetical protein